MYASSNEKCRSSCQSQLMHTVATPKQHIGELSLTGFKSVAVLHIVDTKSS
jgi:hypothetical protein